MNPLVYAVASISLILVSQILFKKGVLYLELRPDSSAGLLLRLWRMVFQKHIFSGLSLNVVAAGCWLLALSHLELSFVFPFLSLNYILIPVFSTILFHEQLSNYRLLGIGVICTGIFLIALS
ncbi:MAG: hypothetical protein DA408_00300 [Bacteroidetes bacterium]|nr:MAG: hypothetical protein C7N36_09030 [Bacteroidota bacterium]PTM15095.1 MAG: hypothetical protein DA408_00300 [Bacteroidota bacterium]